MGVLKGWEAGEIGEHYATTLNIAPSKTCSKMGKEPEIQGYGSREVWTPLSPLRNYCSRSSIEGRLKCLCKFPLLQVLYFNPGYQDDNDDNNNCDDNINDNNNDIDA